MPVFVVSLTRASFVAYTLIANGIMCTENINWKGCKEFGFLADKVQLTNASYQMAWQKNVFLPKKFTMNGLEFLQLNKFHLIADVLKLFVCVQECDTERCECADWEHMEDTYVMDAGSIFS